VAVALGKDGCLEVYPKADWLERETKVRQLSTNDPEIEAYVRILSGSLHRGELDKQHRLFLPPHLREMASLERDIVIVGVFTRLEIWNVANWQAYRERYLQSYTEIARRSGLGM